MAGRRTLDVRVLAADPRSLGGRCWWGIRLGRDADRQGVEIVVRNFDCTTSEVSRHFRARPTRSWLKGDPVPGSRTGGRRPWSFWCKVLAEEELLQLDAWLRKWMRWIESRREAIRRARSKGWYVGLLCYGYLYTDYNTGLTLSEGAMGRLSKVGLPLVVDLYFLGPRPRRKTTVTVKE